MDKLRIRVYNVRFGDAILISVPDRGPNHQVKTRHILIDVGNACDKEGGPEDVFVPVVQNIIQTVGQDGIDLYVMTHEHMDHVKGLLSAHTNPAFAGQDLRKKLKVKHAWLTGSSAPDYYDKYPEAEKKKKERNQAFEEIKNTLAVFEDPAADAARAMWANNNQEKTKKYVDFLRTLAPKGKTWYIHRRTDLNGKHDFTEAVFEIWAPEEDTSEYYGSFQPLAWAAAPGANAEGSTPVSQPLPPAGVDAGAFYDLVKQRSLGWVDNLLTIDKAANNTSIVFCLKWRGYQLLFTGDAEQRSWKTMCREKVLHPIDFFKVGHHGSRTAALTEEIFKTLFPNAAPRQPQAALTTYDDTYANVPDEEGALKLLQTRCKLWDTRKLGDGEYYDIEFEG